jgi:hypothetical protein
MAPREAKGGAIISGSMPPASATVIQDAKANMAASGGMLPVRARIFEEPVERLHDTPGRPSSKALIIEEARRRLASGEPVPKLLYKFSEKLEDWLTKTYPDAPSMKAKVIEGHIRDLWVRRKKN